MVNLQVNHRSMGKKSHTREGRAFLPGNGAFFNMLHSTKKLSPFCAVATGTTATHARVGSTCRSQTVNQFLDSTNFLCSCFPFIHNPFFPFFISGGSPPLFCHFTPQCLSRHWESFPEEGYCWSYNIYSQGKESMWKNTYFLSFSCFFFFLNLWNQRCGLAANNYGSKDDSSSSL